VNGQRLTFRLHRPGRTRISSAVWNRIMASNPIISKTLKPYSAVRRGFCEARRQQWLTQGPVTLEAIQRIQQSRKYAHSPVSAMKRA
jgi:hypothetical protein